MKKMKKITITLAMVMLMALSSMLSVWAATGWRAENGNWYYYSTDGRQAKDQWLKEGDNMYWINEDGTMAANSWHEENTKWFWLDGNGVAATGWREIDGKWYYFYEDCSMATDTTVGSFKIGRDGVWKTN